jgi:hypothetical protein
MFTLLSEQHKKKLFKEYRIRLLITFLIFASVFFVIGIALLFPSFISITTLKSSYENESELLLKEIELKNQSGLASTLNQIQFDLTLAKPDETDVYRSINEILNEVSSEISINTIRYTRGVGAPSSLNLQGIAKDRSGLLSFTNKLKKILIFSSVDLPVSNLAKQTDVPFNITLLGRF